MYNQYKSKINFVTIYIAEAHADDEWPIRTKKSLQFKQHKTNIERWNIANKFIKDYNYQIPCIIDSMKNEFTNIYSSWPARAYLIDNKTNKIKFILNPKDPGCFDFGDIKSAIQDYLL